MTCSGAIILPCQTTSPASQTVPTPARPNRSTCRKAHASIVAPDKEEKRASPAGVVGGVPREPPLKGVTRPTAFSHFDLITLIDFLFIRWGPLACSPYATIPDTEAWSLAPTR